MLAFIQQVPYQLPCGKAVKSAVSCIARAKPVALALVERCYPCIEAS